MSKSPKFKKSHLNDSYLKSSGFTLIELMVGVAVLGIVTMVAVPNLGKFVTKMRVDNEISELHRLILTARNNAINSGHRVVLCPLNAANVCTNNWGDTLSVFIDVNQNNIFEAVNPLDPNPWVPGNPNGDTLLKTKAATSNRDNLTFSGGNNLAYSATGLLAVNNGNFSFCPINDLDRRRGILITASGRPNTSSDIDNNDIDEFRDGTAIVCP